MSFNIFFHILHIIFLSLNFFSLIQYFNISNGVVYDENNLLFSIICFLRFNQIIDYQMSV